MPTGRIVRHKEFSARNPEHPAVEPHCFQGHCFLVNISLCRAIMAPQRIMHQYTACASSLFSYPFLCLIHFQPILLKHSISHGVCEWVTRAGKTVIESARHEIRWLSDSGHIYLGTAISICSLMYVHMSLGMCDVHLPGGSMPVPRSLCL